MSTTAEPDDPHPGEIPVDLPSRPSAVEMVLVCAAVALVGGSVALGLSRSLDDRAEREADVQRLLEAGGQGADASQRFAAREELVDVHLADLRGFLEASDDVAERETAGLVDAVEALVASRQATRSEVRAALAELVRTLDAAEEELGFLDVDLESARELARDALPEKED